MIDEPDPAYMRWPEPSPAAEVCPECGHRATIDGICQVGTGEPHPVTGYKAICGCSCVFPPAPEQKPDKLGHVVINGGVGEQCRLCGGDRERLNAPCPAAPAPAARCTCDHIEHKDTGECVTCGMFCGPVSNEVGREILEAWATPAAEPASPPERIWLNTVIGEFPEWGMWANEHTGDCNVEYIPASRPAPEQAQLTECEVDEVIENLEGHNPVFIERVRNALQTLAAPPPEQARLNAEKLAADIVLHVRSSDSFTEQLVKEIAAIILEAGVAGDHVCEWRTQHENLLAVKDQDNAALLARCGRERQALLDLIEEERNKLKTEYYSEGMIEQSTRARTISGGLDALTALKAKLSAGVAAPQGDTVKGVE